MYFMTDNLGMLYLAYNEYVQSCRKNNKEPKGFFDYFISSLKGDL